MSSFPPLGHVALTVQSCDRSRPWYTALFASEPVLDGSDDTGRHVVWALHGGTFFGIHEHPGKTPNGDGFSAFRIGLDHASFHCRRRAELEEWASRLDQLGYSHGDVAHATYGTALSFRDPDGNALEFFTVPGT
jgi:glyoxylase I family protein